MSGSIGKRILSVGGALVLLAGVGLSARGGVVPRAVASSAPRCMNVQLTLAGAGPLSAGAGHIGQWYKLHNISNRACTLTGFPGVELLDKNFASYPSPVNRSGYLIPAT